MEEEWRDIPNYPGYQASNMGRIRSCRMPGGAYGRTKPWKIIKPWLSSKQSKGSLPHMMVSLCKDAKPKKIMISHLVLMTFVGDRPDGMVCCHNNDNRHDNRLENLRWDTRESNERDADKNLARSFGEENWISKLTDESVIDILKMYESGITQQKIADKYSVERKTISSVVNRRTWKHVRYDEYVKPYKINTPKVASSVKLNMDIANEIRAMRTTGISYRKLGELYGVSPTTICRIVRYEEYSNKEICL